MDERGALGEEVAGEIFPSTCEEGPRRAEALLRIDRSEAAFAVGRVGSRPLAFNIQPIMPVTVDLPLVPAMPIDSGASLNRLASNCARLIRSAPMRVAATISGTLSSTAAEATTTCPADTTPLPSCG